MIGFVAGFFSYFTIWSLFALFFSQLYPHPILMGISKTMIVQSSIGGLYMTYVNPRQLFVPYCRFHMKGSVMKSLDLISHQFPCLFVLTYPYLPVSRVSHKYMFILPILFYISIFSLNVKYNFRNIDIFRLVVILIWVQGYL